MSNNFHFNVDNMVDGLVDYNDKFNIAMAMFCSTNSQRLQSHAQQNRKWTDRTSSAKTRLKGSWYKTIEGKFRLQLAHGVDYGIWLELANEKNYAIIAPTIDYLSPIILRDLGNLHIT